MSDRNSSTKSTDGPTFADQAEHASSNVFVEFVSFLKHNKKWWLAPILIVLAAIAAIVIMGGTVAAPFIYTLF